MVVYILPCYVAFRDIENLISFETVKFPITFRNILICDHAKLSYSIVYPLKVAPRYRDLHLEAGKNTHILFIISDKTLTQFSNRLNINLSHKNSYFTGSKRSLGNEYGRANRL